MDGWLHDGRDWVRLFTLRCLSAEDVEYGQFGNKCHVDCSNRGLCDYNTGVCKCFPDSWGLACEFMANTGGSINMHDLSLPWYESENSSTFIVMQN